MSLKRVKTLVKNTSMRDCNLDQANGGFASHFAVLKKNGGKQEIIGNLSVPYREYWVASDDLVTLRHEAITMLDCVKNSEIIIEDDGSDGLRIRQVPRNSDRSWTSTMRASLERCSIM